MLYELWKTSWGRALDLVMYSFMSTVDFETFSNDTNGQCNIEWVENMKYKSHRV